MVEKKSEIDEVVQAFNAGGVVIFPTETLYGLGCDATNPQALLKVYKVKQREFGKSFPILVKDFNMLADYAIFGADQKKFMQKEGRKRPTNFVLRAKNLSPLTTKHHTAAFRISSSAWVKKFFKKFEKPIVATSANLSGKNPLTDPRKYKEIFNKDAELIDFMIFNGVNKKRVGSRIIDLTKKPYKVLRK
ncbi:MAG: threonylcarbamoyl-AMP synthase [Candidatus Harrisonbacteria bacterium]|nr:threonylcarbamoyl-AMP synthase [Candidatus Harrisonbacteria bacterium]